MHFMGRIYLPFGPGVGETELQAGTNREFVDGEAGHSAFEKLRAASLLRGVSSVTSRSFTVN